MEIVGSAAIQTSIVFVAPPCTVRQRTIIFRCATLYCKAENSPKVHDLKHDRIKPIAIILGIIMQCMQFKCAVYDKESEASDICFQNHGRGGTQLTI
jgi:hypothetical protein